ncbi:MAG: hypothetical protein ABI920_16200, partial [Casimicrobiaceae bacterium]
MRRLGLPAAVGAHRRGRHAVTPGPARLRPREWLALVAALAIGHAFRVRIVRFPSDFDAVNYVQIATDIAQHGLFRPFYYANIRTYGYPLVLAGLERMAARIGVDWLWLVFEVQLFAYLAACVAVRNAVARHDPVYAPWVLVTLALNVFALSYAPETLTESLALTLLMLSAAMWIRMRVPGAALQGRVLAAALLGSFAVMVRPASLFALMALAVALLLVVFERRVGWRAGLSMAVMFVVGTALPMAPQVINNLRNYGEATPLVVARLGTNQQIWGIQYLKYATALPPVPLPSVFYDNPLAANRPIDFGHPLAWYWRYPWAGARTLALHVFNMLDQDLFFTYARSLDPWYRVPVAILNHALLGFAVIGGVLMVARRRLAVTAVAVIAFLAAHLGLHATTAVEMRFGLPLLVLAGPLAAFGWQVLHRNAAQRAWLAAVILVAAWVTGALVLSDWVRAQAP